MTQHRRVVFFLDSGLDPDDYADRWRRGLVPDRLPYGIEHAPEGWTFEIAARRVPRGLRRIGRFLHGRLGFDLLRALVNRRALSRADAVYCHTEVEYLAVAAVLPRHGGPILAGQTIWIFHRFASLPVLRRRLVRRLIRRVDLLIANAEPNVELGRAIAPAAVHRYLPFGISRAFASDDRRPGSPQVLGVGNDAARDWDVFAHAVEDAGVVDVRVASKAPVHVRGTDVAVATSGLAELRELYATSALVLLAARENAHASGITTLLEAAAAGTPVVATRTGGLDAYFTDDEVAFVEPGSRDALSAAVRRDLADPAARERRGRAAREAMDRSALWNDCYWRRVVDELSGLPLGSRP